MRVLLIYPNIIESPKEISAGLASVGAILKEDGHTVRLIDTTFGGRSDKEIMERVNAFKPEMVCITVATNDFKFGMHLLDIIREQYPHVPTIVGGIHPTVAPEETLMQKNVDMICVGEGDLPIRDVARMLQKGEKRTDIHNIWFKKNGKAIPNPQRQLPNLDDLPIPDRGLFDFQRYIDWHGGTATVISTRGCPYPCTYCVNRKQKEIYKGNGLFVRYKSVDKLLAEIKEMKEKYRLKEVLFNDDTFTLDPRRIKEFCEKYPTIIGTLPFTINGRVNTVTREMLMMLGKAGCTRINMGVECGNPHIRNTILERDMTDQQIIDTFRWAREAGIKTYAFNMIGIPHETRENIQETIELNRKINPDFVGVSIFTAFPGTPLYDLCKKNGWLEEEYSSSYFQDTNVRHPNFTIDELKKIRDSFGFEVYRKTKPLRAYVDLIDKKFTKYHTYMRVRSMLIAAGFKKVLARLDKDNFFDVPA
ncbi:cobalamin B12-binding domain-containing protein [Candidatus Woesearchaeota archaeon]|nr:cobalamin B12-binding domain-containing protein [Candidatus Woesearchaeota archaeon]